MYNIAAPVHPIKGIPPRREKPLEGGKWTIVEEFEGKSHEEGGIDILVSGGRIRHIYAPHHKPDFNAGIGGWFKKAWNAVSGAVSNVGQKLTEGSTWRSIGAAAYGVGEGLLDTITLGATDQLTDMGYEALQRAGGSTESQIREQNSLRGYGTTAGAITGGILTGGAATGTAISQGAKGVGAGVSYGSPDSKFAQAVGTYLPLAGSIAGMVTGNAGYAAGSKLGKFAEGAAKLSKYNPLIQAGLSSFMKPQGQAPVSDFDRGVRDFTPFLSDGVRGGLGFRRGGGGGGYGLGAQIAGEAAPLRGTGGSMMDGIQSFGGEGGPVQFQQQPIQQSDAFNYLGKYGINV